MISLLGIFLRRRFEKQPREQKSFRKRENDNDKTDNDEIVSKNEKFRRLRRFESMIHLVSSLGYPETSIDWDDELEGYKNLKSKEVLNVRKFGK